MVALHLPAGYSVVISSLFNLYYDVTKVRWIGPDSYIPCDSPPGNYHIPHTHVRTCAIMLICSIDTMVCTVALSCWSLSRILPTEPMLCEMTYHSPPPYRPGRSWIANGTPHPESRSWTKLPWRGPRAVHSGEESGRGSTIGSSGMGIHSIVARCDDSTITNGESGTVAA